MKIILFGSSNPSGSAFIQLCRDQRLEIWSRRTHKHDNIPHIFCDLSSGSLDHQNILSGVLVSFAPIWLLAFFLESLFRSRCENLHQLRGIVACSSSSYLTKRFSFNEFDKNLSLRLSNAHSSLQDVCRSLSIPCMILAPSLVYGKVDAYSDKNLTRILQIMRIFPIIFLPKITGLRQPIHATQLAKAMKRQTDDIINDQLNFKDSNVIVLGGDETMTYENMIRRITEPLPRNDAAKHCKLLTVPNQLFYLLTMLILPGNPKLFEAIMRTQSNLSGFTKVHQLLKEEPQSFPVSDVNSQTFST
jgi:hypothetical protein